MPPVHNKPPPRVDPFAFAPGTMDGIANLLRTMSEIKAQRKKRQMNDDVLRAASQAGTPEERQTRVNEVIRSHQGPYSDDLKDQMAQATLESVFRDVDPYRQAQIENAKALAEQRRNRGTVQSYSQTPESKGFDRDVKILSNPKSPEGSRNSARGRLVKNPNIITDPNQAEFPVDYSEHLKGTEITRRTKKFGIGFDDDVYGYEETLKKAIDDGLGRGIHPDLIKQDFDQWWDEQSAKNKGQFRTYEERVLDERQTIELLKEAGGDVARAREIAKERNWKIAE